MELYDSGLSESLSASLELQSGLHLTLTLPSPTLDHSIQETNPSSLATATSYLRVPSLAFVHSG